MSGRGPYLALAKETYAEQIMSQSGVDGSRAYLTDHGIAERRIVEKYGLGFVAEPLPGDERFEGMLAIPYLHGDTVVAIKYRNLSGHGPKYAQHHGQKPRLYNADAFFLADHVIGIAEGEPDSVAASERLGVPSFGCPGVDVWGKMSTVWRPIFKDFQHVMIFADGDEAGKGFAAQVAEDIGWRARIVQCPDGEDVGSMCAAGRTEELRAKCQLASQ